MLVTYRNCLVPQRRIGLIIMWEAGWRCVVESLVKLHGAIAVFSTSIFDGERLHFFIAAKNDFWAPVPNGHVR